MTNLAVRITDRGDAELTALAEHIERRAWTDMVDAAPHWLRLMTGIQAQQIAGGALMLSAPGIDHLLFNRVIGLGEHLPATEQQVTDLMGRYWEHSIERYWVHVSPYARPARLGRLLQEQGLAPYRRSWVKLVRPAQRAPTAQSSFTVREARAADATAVASIVGPGFDLPQTAAELFGALVGRRGWRVYVAELDGQIAGAAGMFTDRDVAYLAFAATRNEFRRRGAQRALLQARLNAAADADVRWIATETGFPLSADPSNPSYHNLLWAGFKPVAVRDNYAPPGTVWDHGGKGALLARGRD